MSNWKIIAKILGLLLYIEAGLMLVCTGVSVWYGEDATVFVWPAVIAVAIGTAGVLAGLKSGKNMGRRDGYIVVSTVWILFTLIGMLPFLLDGCISDVSSAFFETMSGFTSTGATIVDDPASMDKGLLFWRSMTQWIGGIGIVFFTIAVLPAFGAGEVKLFAAESTGPLHDKVHPRISVAAKCIGTVYLLITVLCIVTLMGLGTGMFDAVNLAMTTAGTGGFFTHSEFIRDVYHSASVEYALIFFMFISGVNYTLLYYTALKGRLRKLFSDAEMRCYLLIIVASTLTCTVVLALTQDSGYGVELAFRDSLFTVVSMQTTTGLATCDYTLWPVNILPVILFVMFAGACSGSTSGGFKCVRWSIIFRVVKNELMRILHPRAVLPVKLNGNVVPTPIIKTLLAFVALFVGALFVGAFILTLCDVDTGICHDGMGHAEAFSLALSSISNVGPGMGYYGPAHSWSILSPTAKTVCSFLMLIGRLEIFPVIILFTRGFWKKS